jgi:DNA segregation ATPase FtsK/SpoIIIE-like protein
MKYTLPLTGFKLTTLVVIGTDCKLITIDQPTIKHELDSLNTHQTPFQYLIAISNMLDHTPRLANLCYETDANLKWIWRKHLNDYIHLNIDICEILKFLNWNKMIMSIVTESKFIFTIVNYMKSPFKTGNQNQ